MPSAIPVGWLLTRMKPPEAGMRSAFVTRTSSFSVSLRYSND